MDYSIRELRQNESKVLNTFLYEAIFIPADTLVLAFCSF